MSGITGLIHLAPQSEREAMARLMTRGLVHEPGLLPGQESFPSLRLIAGWASRLGDSSSPVVWNPDRSVALLFSGEVFGDPGPLSNPRDAQHLLRLYEQTGPAFLSSLNGRFHGLLVDLCERKAILFNDRYGLARIYWHQCAEGFFFSSSARSILAVRPELRRLDPRGLAEFFSVGCVLQNRSLFRDVSLLPPASAWTFHADGRVVRDRYFDPGAWEQQPTLSPAAYEEKLIETFRRIAPRYLAGAEPVAMSLTGGLDSRMLLAWIGAAPGTLPCYTFGGPYRDCHDVRIARELARVCGQPHTTIPIGRDFFSGFTELAQQNVTITDGAMDVSGAVELYVNRKAREIAPVRLTGNYGSEILRSNIAFRPARLDRSVFTPEFSVLIDQAADTYRTEAAGHRLSFIAFKQVPWHHYARFAVEQSQLTPRSPFLDNEAVALAYQAPPELATSPLPLLSLIAAGNPALDAVRTDRALTRRPGSVFGRMARSWQEFTAKAEYAWDYGMPDKLARVERFTRPLHLERLFLGRHKFYHFRIWYRNQLAASVRRLALEGGSQSSCYQDRAVGQIVEDHLSGRRNRTSELHKLLAVRIIETSLLKRT